VIRFTVPGPPVPKARARIIHRASGAIQAFTPEATAKYELKVGLCARTAGIRPDKGELALSVWFYTPNARRMDLDNLLKSVMDGLNGIAWEDDSQVAEVHASRMVDHLSPRAVVSIGPRKGP
jgi:crossover junction endodeoxyribonuclease RusA